MVEKYDAHELKNDKNNLWKELLTFGKKYDLAEFFDQFFDPRNEDLHWLTPDEFYLKHEWNFIMCGMTEVSGEEFIKQTFIQWQEKNISYRGNSRPDYMNSTEYCKTFNTINSGYVNHLLDEEE